MRQPSLSDSFPFRGSRIVESVSHSLSLSPDQQGVPETTEGLISEKRREVIVSLGCKVLSKESSHRQDHFDGIKQPSYNDELRHQVKAWKAKRSGANTQKKQAAWWKVAKKVTGFMLPLCHLLKIGNGFYVMERRKPAKGPAEAVLHIASVSDFSKGGFYARKHL